MRSFSRSRKLTASSGNAASNGRAVGMDCVVQEQNGSHKHTRRQTHTMMRTKTIFRFDVKRLWRSEETLRELRETNKEQNGELSVHLAAIHNGMLIL